MQGKGDHVDDRSQGPQFPELAGPAEIAAILGVSKQRVRELAAQDDTFPQPVAELIGGAIYVKSMIEEYQRQSTRQPGRPTKEHTQMMTQVMTEMRHIPKTRGDLAQQTFRTIFNITRQHDLKIDPLTPAGQSLHRSIEAARTQYPDSEPQYDAEFFQPEPLDQHYRTRHSACPERCGLPETDPT